MATRGRVHHLLKFMPHCQGCSLKKEIFNADEDLLASCKQSIFSLLIVAGTEDAVHLGMELKTHKLGQVISCYSCFVLH